MASTYSFDIVSDYDLSEVDHAVDQTKRELANRYDLKSSSAAIEFVSSDKTGVKITGDNDYHLEAVIDMLRKKLGKRSVSQKILDASGKPAQQGMQLVWIVPFKKGLDKEKAKKITKLLRDEYPKVKTQIQGEEVRVTSPKKDELQAVMNLLREKDFDFPLSFVNFR